MNKSRSDTAVTEFRVTALCVTDLAERPDLDKYVGCGFLRGRRARRLVARAHLTRRRFVEADRGDLDQAGPVTHEVELQRRRVGKIDQAVVNKRSAIVYTHYDALVVAEVRDPGISR